MAATDGSAQDVAAAANNATTSPVAREKNDAAESELNCRNNNNNNNNNNTKSDSDEGGGGGEEEDGDEGDEEDYEEEDEEDNEDTLAEEEALAEAEADAGDNADELAGLEAEADMPLDQLLALYGGYNGAAAAEGSRRVAEEESAGNDRVDDEGEGEEDEVVDGEEGEEDDPDYAIPSSSHGSASFWCPKEPRIGLEYQADVPEVALSLVAGGGDSNGDDNSISSPQRSDGGEEAASAMTVEDLDALESGLEQLGKKFPEIRERHFPDRPLGQIVAGYYRWKATRRGREFIRAMRLRKAAAVAIAEAAAAAAALAAYSSLGADESAEGDGNYRAVESSTSAAPEAANGGHDDDGAGVSPTRLVSDANASTAAAATIDKLGRTSATD